MSTPLTRQRPSSQRRGDLAGIVIAGLLYAAAMAVVVPAIRTPAHVDRITIDNPHAWWVSVDVTERDRDGWLGLGAVDRNNQHTFHTVIDQGDTWIFDFAYGGEHAELRVSRAQLERADWQVIVPDEFADQLRSADVPETPP